MSAKAKGQKSGNSGNIITHELDECPQRDKHTKCPKGYLDWHAWADNKAKTHRQIRCDGCGRFAIWVPKRKRGVGVGDTPPT